MTPEAAAEEMYPDDIGVFQPGKKTVTAARLEVLMQRFAFIAGHHSRDQEIERLVEALREIVRISDRKHDAWDKAKEALKQYQK